MEYKVKSVDLFVTEKCNMNCEYCFHPQESRKDVLTLEQGKKILDELYKLNPEDMMINFWGGEPLLEPQLILDLALYAKELWQDFKHEDVMVTRTKFHIVTNGTYFDEGMFAKYKALGFTLQVSLDGDEITHKTHRGSVENHTIICTNIGKMLHIFPDLSVRMTYTPKTVGRLAMNVQFIRDLGVVRIMHHATMEDTWDKEAISQYMYQLSQIYNYRRWMIKNGNQINIAFIDKNLSIINGEAPPELDFCQAGKTYIAVLPNGDVYPCHRAASNRIFKLGNIFEKRKVLRGIFAKLDKEYSGCSVNCHCFTTCHSCPITHFLVNKDLAKPLSENGYCDICKAENFHAQQFLPIEIADRNERRTKKMMNVLIDIAEQNEEILKELRNDKRAN